MGAVSESPGRFEELLKVLGIPTDKLPADLMIELQCLLREYSDVFAPTDQELGCTSFVHHSIDTGEHRPIRQRLTALPYPAGTPSSKWLGKCKNKG